MTFCYYLDTRYSLERFEQGTLDYCLHSCPVEIWGTPDNIVAGLKAHNRIIQNIAVRSPKGVVFVDQNVLMPKDGSHFNDICHMTHLGCSVFADNIINAVPNGVL
jgi:hypothetical protein